MSEPETGALIYLQEILTDPVIYRGVSCKLNPHIPTIANSKTKYHDVYLTNTSSQALVITYM